MNQLFFSTPFNNVKNTTKSSSSRQVHQPMDVVGNELEIEEGTPADKALKANAIHARQIAKQQECAVFYMSQLSAEAEGKVVLNQAMMEGSRTGKAAEADLMVLIAKNPVVDGQEEEDTQRHLNVVKNKLSGWHGVVHCDLEYKTARYQV